MRIRNDVTLLLLSLLWIVSATSSCLAVWPPSTSLDRPAASGSKSSEMDRAAFRQTHPPIQRLQTDTQRLEEVLKDLKEDSQALGQSPEETTPQNPRHL